MGEFEQWFKSLNENGRVTYFLGQESKIAKEAWDFQQSKIEQLEKRIKDGLEKIEQCEKEGCLFPEWLYWAKKALRGENENQD